MVDGANLEDTVFPILEDITGSHGLRENLDTPLFDEGLLDSFGLMQLIVAVSEALHIDIPPAEVDRADWSTPRKVIESSHARVASH